MMKRILLLIGMLTVSYSMQAQAWVQQLKDQNKDMIDSIVGINDARPIQAGGYHSYHIYFHQPLEHEVAGSPTFPMRAVLTVPDNQNQPEKAPVYIYFSGYNMYAWDDPEALLSNPAKWPVDELALRYNASLLQIEHRYSGESAPAEPWKTIGYCHASEAAADFHALIQGMKKVFGAKWIISGISKGGITAAMQQAYYPEDADLFVPNSAPFCSSQADTRLYEYMMSSKTWTPAMHQAVLNIIHKITSDSTVYNWHKKAYGLGSEDSVRYHFLGDATNILFSLHAHSTRDKITSSLTHNQQVLDSLKCKDYTDEMLLYFITKETINLDSGYFEWYDKNFTTTSQGGKAKYKPVKTDKLKIRTPLSDVYSITEAEYKRYFNIMSYFYQAGLELGYYTISDIDKYFENPEDATSAEAAVNKLGCLYSFSLPEYGRVEFDSSLRNFVLNRTQNATKPLLFLYGGDDPWTGAAMDDYCINGKNVRKYILSAQKHGVCITNTDASIRDEIFAFTDQIMGTPTTIKGVTDTQAASASPFAYTLQGLRIKVGDMQQGQIYIYNGKKIIAGH